MSSVSLPAAPALLRRGTPSWVATLVACVCAFMVVMDGAIVNIALPAMRQELALSAVQLQWVVDAYLLLLGGFMLLAARAGDLYGRRALLLWGLALFSLASLVGGMAQSAWMLLSARAVQGFAAAALATSPLAVIMAGHPKGAGRERAIGLWAACAALGSAFGVVAGGLLTSLYSWRWVMWVNVPVALLLMAVVGALLNPRAADVRRQSLDVPGALSVTLALGALIFALAQSTRDGWNDPWVQAALGVAVLALVLFVVVQRRASEPLVRLEILRLRNVPIGMLMIGGLGAVLTCSTYFLSQALQRVVGLDAWDTGLALLPLALALAVAAMLSRRLREAGCTRLPLFGGLISALGLAWLYGLPAQPSMLHDLLLPTLLTGVGCGLTLMSATQAVLSGVPQGDCGLAAGLQNAARQLGGAIGLALLVALAHGVSGDLAGTVPPVAAELAGYQAAFLAAALISCASALLSLALRHGES
ncbi:MFS transporter [Pseudomonas sp. TKO26]|uniref:MFS transporter n=1 Tax=unclassified Pseudomonas TaxID=196821 RepID=UPI000D910013|nr:MULTISPECIES: MFS transporter [unclassified Pseudomonas]PYY82191.1 MFS transporter [Pseudomonas sp. TKO30]PYY83655.1 MFS transporter [Pseudomonas sp. TKO29]PYY85612.1 MFS transporter [Pseudomonas sp. TKO26]PYY97907.1 MFS transporter [Pseudomonas sp. TKO14]